MPISEVTPEVRQSAKAINFGIVYGMSEFGLSQQLKISRAKAREFIASYFKQYPGIQQYMADTKKFCAETGYVQTLVCRCTPLVCVSV